MRRPGYRRIAVTGLAGIVVLAGILRLLPAHPADDHPFFQGVRQPLVVAHRGSAVLWPENTLYGFERALAMGADVIETDVRATADGVPVLLHDATVNRTTNATGVVRALTLAELGTLDAGYHWTPDGGHSYPYRGQGLTVPTLEALMRTFPQARMILEIKQDDRGLIRSICRTIREYGMHERALVASFSHEALLHFRQLCPEVATSATIPEVRQLLALSTVGLGHLYRPAAQAVQSPEYLGAIRVLSPGLIAAARRLNLHVHAFTVNDDDDMRRLLDLGVNGIVTDRPDRMRSVLARTPAAAPE